MHVKLNVNGKNVAVASDDPEMPLLYALRDDLGLHGPRFGCGLGQCGACTVLVDSEPVFSCITPILVVQERSIRTLEGLGTAERPGAVQQAFIDEQSAQCGYCIPGMIVRAQALLEKNPEPTDEEIRKALNGNLCRCGTHMRILRAVRRAAQSFKAGKS